MTFLLITVLSFGIFLGYHSQPTAQCKENEEYLECGSPCMVNCSNMNDPIFCTKPCYSGCFCRPEFVQDLKGNCVHPRDCYKAGYRQCPVNEHYAKCVNFCNTCWESGDCRTHYCTPGCDCKPGFYRNIYGQCVTSEECLASDYDSSYGICGANEFFSNCVNLCNDCVSRGRCDFEYHCEHGCDCKPGHFRNERGDCVLEKFCFQRCSEDQIFSYCGPSCISTCENYKRLLYHPCKEDCVSGCICPRNRVLGPYGTCIETKDCPEEKSVCPPDEQYYVCIPTCGATCNSAVVCNTSCKRGCFCRGGLLRRQDGKCVLPRDCPVLTATERLIAARRGGEDEEDSTIEETNTTPTQSSKNLTTVESFNTNIRQGGTDKEDSTIAETNTMSTQSSKNITTTESLNTNIRPRGTDKEDSTIGETNPMPTESSKNLTTTESFNTNIRPGGTDKEDATTGETNTMPTQSITSNQSITDKLEQNETISPVQGSRSFTQSSTINLTDSMSDGELTTSLTTTVDSGNSSSATTATTKEISKENSNTEVTNATEDSN